MPYDQRQFSDQSCQIIDQVKLLLGQVRKMIEPAQFDLQAGVGVTQDEYSNPDAHAMAEARAAEIEWLQNLDEFLAEEQGRMDQLKADLDPDNAPDAEDELAIGEKEDEEGGGYIASENEVLG